jgi:cobalt-zinc-cadmium resistance protein CzcA
MFYVIFLALPSGALAQQELQKVSLEEALTTALKNNAGILASQYEVEGSRAMRKTASEIGKTTVTGTFGQYNSYAKEDNNITITQAIPFPTSFAANTSLANAQWRSSELKHAAAQNELTFQVKRAYYQLLYLKSLQQWLTDQDTIHASLVNIATVRHRTGEANLLEKTSAESRAQQARTMKVQNEADIRIAQTRLGMLMNAGQAVDIASAPLVALSLTGTDTSDVSANPVLRWYQQQTVVAEKQKRVDKNKLLPDLHVGYFNQTLIGTPVSAGSTELATRSDRFQGFQLGLSLPLWAAPQVARVRAAEAQRQSAEYTLVEEKKNLQGQLDEAYQYYLKYRDALNYYETSSLPNATLLQKQSLRAYEQGEIGLAEYLQNTRTANEISLGYFETLNNYNQAVINIGYLVGR